MFLWFFLLVLVFISFHQPIWNSQKKWEGREKDGNVWLHSSHVQFQVCCWLLKYSVCWTKKNITEREITHKHETILIKKTRRKEWNKKSEFLRRKRNQTSHHVYTYMQWMNRPQTFEQQKGIISCHADLKKCTYYDVCLKLNAELIIMKKKKKDDNRRCWCGYEESKMSIWIGFGFGYGFGGSFLVLNYEEYWFETMRVQQSPRRSKTPTRENPNWSPLRNYEMISESKNLKFYFENHGKVKVIFAIIQNYYY